MQPSAYPVLDPAPSIGLDGTTAGYIQVTIDKFTPPTVAATLTLRGQQPAPGLVTIESVSQKGVQTTRVRRLPIFQGKVSILLYLYSPDYMISGAILKSAPSGFGRLIFPSYTVARNVLENYSWIVFNDVCGLSPKTPFPYLITVQKIGGGFDIGHIDPEIENDTVP